MEARTKEDNVSSSQHKHFSAQTQWPIVNLWFSTKN